jgi:cytochrome c oxidase cbb3-type subunit 3
MKFRNYLETITGIGIFPLISLIIFFVFFVSLIIYVLRLDKKDVLKMSQIPLSEGLVNKYTLAVILFCTISTPSFAAEEEPVLRAISGTDLLLYTLLAVLFFLAVLIVVTLCNALNAIKRIQKAKGLEADEKSIFSEKWWKHFGGVGVALSEEKNILIEGHDYDGIQELDNQMPPWLQSLFIGTVFIAIGYSIYYFGGYGDMQLAELDHEIATAEIEKKAYIEKVGASMDENNVTLLEDAGGIEQGKTIFQEKCSACHGIDGGGSVGPNLADAYWLHGGKLNDIFKVIKYGVPEKGMISWEKQLSPTDIQKVASFVISLKGTTPTSPKEPQGELVTEEAVAAN